MYIYFTVWVAINTTDVAFFIDLKNYFSELPDGTVVEVSQKPERTRKKKKINVNNHNPYGVDFI